MDWVQIHLALNHVPVVGIPLLIIMLIAGWWRNSNELMHLALWSLLWLAAAAIAIKFTGDFAAEQAAARLAPAQDFVTRHEQAGDQVTTAVFVLGLLIAATLWLGRRGRPVPGWTLTLVVAMGLVTCLLCARSAHTGGQITHPELRWLSLASFIRARRQSAKGLAQSKNLVDHLALRLASLSGLIVALKRPFSF